MNLSDYISLTLNEIAEGVQKANKAYDDQGEDFVFLKLHLGFMGFRLFIGMVCINR